MGITSFTLNGLGVDTAASGISGTVPRSQKRVKGTRQDVGPAGSNSWLSGWNHQFLSDEKAIAVGERDFCEECIFRYAEAGRDPRERVTFSYDVTLLLTGSWNRWWACGRDDNRESRGGL
jgi:hypothetical protein